MKNAILIIVIIMGLIFAGWIWHARQQAIIRVLGGSSMAAAGDNEPYAHKLARYRTGSDDAVRAACTNYIVGLRNIIDQRIETSDHNFKNWTATAIVEYINTIGGVDRTNLDLKFDPTFDGQPRWWKIQ